MRLAKRIATAALIGALALPAFAPAATRAGADFAARDAYYSGDVQKAYKLAPAAGERWVAGLAAYRLGKQAEALKFFSAVADDAKEGQWIRAGAAFWAARSASLQGDNLTAAAKLRQAAQWPATFYGMIAARNVELNRVATPAPDEPRPAVYTFLIGAVSEPANLLGPLINDNDFPTPELFPVGGFTLNPALVYAMVRQESRFNPNAVSPAGAVGLMQLMPAAAAQVGGGGDPISLFDPATNLRLGQDYMAWLVDRGLSSYDLLCALAAYNGGPATVKKVVQQIGGSQDALMIIESMPAKETRDYVEQVMTGYWTYQRKFGLPTPSLDSLAGGYSSIDIRMDT